MCGRFALSAKTSDIEKLLPGLKSGEEFTPRYNIAPTQNIPVVLNDGSNDITSARWGLIPFWAKDKSIGSRMINARAETINEKASFKNPFRKKRCLIIADGFFEWKKIAGQKAKIPYFIKFKSGGPFTFAGLWDEWKDPMGKPLRSATIITTTPNELIEDIHDRMPAILLPEDRELWIEAENAPEDLLLKALGPYPATEMELYEVSSAVNNPAFDDPSCIKPVN